MAFNSIFIKQVFMVMFLLIKNEKKSPWELMIPGKKNDLDKTQDICTPNDPLTSHKIDILIKQLLCQFEGLLVF